MLKELQAHYLDLVVQAAEAAGSTCLLRKQNETSGVIYAAIGPTTTKVDYRITFAFDHENAEVALTVKFVDARPNVTFKATYLVGIDEFFPLFAKALRANRLEAVQS